MSSGNSLNAVAGDANLGGISQVGFRVASIIGVPDPINYTLTVQYRTPDVTGPLIPGFDPFPETITAEFLLGDVLPGQTFIGIDQVQSFDLEIPGDNPTEGDLDYFQFSLDSSGSPTSLNWGVVGFAPGVEILNNNFTLEITGADPATGEPFRYFWSESTNTFAAVPEPSGLVMVALVVVVMVFGVGGRRTPGGAGGCPL
jgi:hypothetical protein